MLLDSNIIIYAAQPKHHELPQLIAEQAPAVSAISYVEVLGYDQLTTLEKRYFGMFFNAATILGISESIILRAVELRQRRKMTLGDALIGATALVHNLTLITHNPKDFDWIPGLSVNNPLAIP
jgi:predicted nucleic acid-binding protein